MNADPLLPIAPARVKALVLPVGKIQEPRFSSFLQRLAGEHVVHLRDISADGRPNRNMFSPLAFPDGAIFYELVTHMPQPSHLALSPFDLYREPLVILAVADGGELSDADFIRRQSGGGISTEERNIRNLDQELEELRDTFTKAIVHQVLIFDYVPDKENPIPVPEGIFTIPPVEESTRTTMKTVMCDVSSLLLAEMTALARRYERMNFIESPGQSSTVRQLNGSAWAVDDAAMLARRNSQYSVPGNARSTSASGIPDRSQNRLSMPVPPKGAPFGSASSTPARPSTPVRSGLSNPPTTFDDIADANSSDPASPEQTPGSRPGTAEGLRTHSQDRISVQGFGSGGVNDRWRNKGKGRVTVVMGSLYLQAGRWTDALKELIEGAAVAKSINDHLWHGKALELIMVSLILLGWAGVEFQIPLICRPVSDKPSESTAQALEAAAKNDPDQKTWLRSLQVLLPELLERIIGLYSRVVAEHLPPLPLAETTIRFCKIYAALHVHDGKLNDDSFKMMLFGGHPDTPLSTSPRITVIPARATIVNTLFRAFPGSTSELLTTVDRIVILSGIASVLGVIGFHRKKAMVVRELVSVLTGGLVEARTRGAAEVGIHPAAGLLAVNGVNGHANGASPLELGEGDIEFGVDAFLNVLLRTYGVVEASPGSSEPDDSDSAAVSRIQSQSTARLFGIQGIKLDVLRACINFSEALPDFGGVLKFSSDLLRTSGSGIAPGPRLEDVSPAIARDEQVRLVTNISKTSTLSRRLGFGDLTAEYWDEFLVRGVKLEPSAASRLPVEHKKSELVGSSTARSSQDVDPFIHNPFLKRPDKTTVEQTLVAGEPAMFKFTLQNPFEIEVDIESIRLDTEGVEFESSVESAIIGPYQSQIVRVAGTPKASGLLSLTGGVVRIRGCRERRFPLFPQPWAPEGESKVKVIGLSPADSPPKSPTGPAPKAEHVKLNVIPPQPVVVVKSTTLPQSSIMILEGERQAFSVTLQNLSSTPVDFLLFSFRDSTQEPTQAALNNRDASPIELYECEVMMTRKHALRIRKREDEKRFIPPGETATFDFEILGKPGLTYGVIQVDYAHLGGSPEEIATKFYTRQVSLELTITVNASIEVTRMDILPLHGSIPEPLWGRVVEKDSDGKAMTEDKYCLMVLDLRNAWPSDMVVKLEVGDGAFKERVLPGNTNIEVADGAVVEEHILPGNTNRVLLPLERVHLDDPHAPIPTLNPSRQRQFVVSTGKISPDMERTNREGFWYRESILNSLRGTWRTRSGAQRGGTIDLRSKRLTARMIEAVKIEDVGIDISVEDGGARKVHHRKNLVAVDDFVRVTVRITNRGAQPIYPTLRLAAALCHRPPNVALDLARKFAWNGTPQQSLPLLEGNTSTEVVIGATALCRGEFDITASVEETQLWIPRTEEEKKRQSKRPRSNTETMMDAALGPTERRIWYSRRPCRLVVKDEDN